MVVQLKRVLKNHWIVHALKMDEFMNHTSIKLSMKIIKRLQKFHICYGLLKNKNEIQLSDVQWPAQFGIHMPPGG